MRSEPGKLQHKREATQRLHSQPVQWGKVFQVFQGGGEEVEVDCVYFANSLPRVLACGGGGAGEKGVPAACCSWVCLVWCCVVLCVVLLRVTNGRED